MKKKRERKKKEPETVHDDNDNENDWINCKNEQTDKKRRQNQMKKEIQNINILLKNCAWSQRRDDDGDGNGISSNSSNQDSTVHWMNPCLNTTITKAM